MNTKMNMNSPANTNPPFNTDAKTAVPVGKTLGQHFKTWRAWGILILITLTALTISTVLSSTASGSFDPNSSAPKGTKGFYTVLGKYASQLEKITDPFNLGKVDADTVVTVVDNEHLYDEALKQIGIQSQHAKRLVILTNKDHLLENLGIETFIHPSGFDEDISVPRGRCKLPIFGDVTKVSAPQYVFDSGLRRPVKQCFLYKNASGLGIWPAGQRTTPEGEKLTFPETVVIANPQWFTNDHVALEQNGALGINLLADSAKLKFVYVDPSFAGADSVQDTPENARTLIPLWLQKYLYLLGFAMILFIIYKRIRFGRLAYERLPITVKSAETAQSLGRLYEQNQANTRVAALLQQHALKQLRKRLFLTASTTDLALLKTLQARTGKSELELQKLLLQPFNGSTNELALLSKNLDALIQEVTHD